MRSLHKYLQRQKGFTIVELLIVIVIIGILATLVIVTFSGIQQRARDTQRQTDVNAIQSQVEAYFAQTGNYPTLGMITDSDFRTDHMRGFPADSLTAPDGTTISDAAAADGHYQYEVWTDEVDGTTCPDETGTSPDLLSVCQAYRITADLEASGAANYVKTSN